MRIYECLKWLWKVSAGFRLYMAGYALAGITQVGVSLFFVYVCKHLIDIATGVSDDDLNIFIGLLLCCMVMQLALSVMRSRLSARTEIRLRNELRRRLFVHLMESCGAGREAFHSGDLLNRLEEDVVVVTDAFCRTIPAVAVTTVQLAGAFCFLSILDARLAGVLVFIMPVALLFSKRYVNRMRRISREIRATDSRVQSHLQENLQNRILIRTLEYTSQSIERLVSMQQALCSKVMERTDFSVFSRSMVQLGFMAGYAVALLWGVFGLRDGSVTFGMVTAFFQLVSQVQRPMVDLSRQIPSFIRVFISTERLAELLALPLEQQGDAVRLEGRLGIRAEGICFTYPEGKRAIFTNFTYNFTPGSLTAVIGETGVGKTTLLKLILSLMQPDEGSLTVYNETREETISPLTRCNFSYVPQGNTLVSGSIRDNLMVGNPNATERELRSALYMAAADFVFALPDGMDTLCGEQGAGLSEGQAQRIAIARGLLRPGNVLLLDEPTSSLDTETENLLLKRLSECLHGKTLLLITHREAIARLCTSVVRM